jgi:hypothetical protein
MYNISLVLEQLNHVESGEHCILIYPNLATLREIYTQYYKKMLLKKEMVLFLLEGYESNDLISDYLTASGIDVIQNLGNGSLVLASSLKKFFSSESLFVEFLDVVRGDIDRMGNKNGMTIITDGGSYCSSTENMTSSTENMTSLIDFESFISSIVDIKPVKLLCIYNRDDFNILTEEQKQILVQLHSKKLLVES